MFNFSAFARHSLTSRYELVPGVPFVLENDNDLNPPDWTVNSRVSWNRRGTGLSLNYRHVDAVVGGGLVRPAIEQLQVSANHRFQKPLFGRWGRGAVVQLSLSDLLQDDPPFADTINGYRTGSAMGRTWMLSLRVPLRPSNAGAGGRGGGGNDMGPMEGMGGDDD